jgi:hypothetical protein
VRIQIAVPEEHVTKPVLDGALEAVTRLDEQLIKSGVSPTSEQLIAQGAKWKPEPPGQEHFDHGAEIAKRGWGDCDDWAPLRAATLRVSGEDPGARAVVRKSGHKRWHATVIRSDGSEDDPSLDAGMPGPARAVGVVGSWQPSMRERIHGVGGTFIATPHLALRPVPDRFGQIESWQARADLPWHVQPSDSPADVAMVTLHQSPVADQAVVGAVLGAFDLGLASGYADPEHLKRMSAVAEACQGVPWEEIADAYGEEHATAAGALVEGFFGKALKSLGKVAKGGLKFVTKNPLGKLATSVIPGAGLATAAFNMASPGTQKSVMQQQHLPPPQRAPVRSVPSGGAGGGGYARPAAAAEPNAVLLTAFADRLQRAYEFGRAPCPAPARAPAARAPAARARRAPAPRARRAPSTTRPRPGTAWPR